MNMFVHQPAQSILLNDNNQDEDDLNERDFDLTKKTNLQSEFNYSNTMKSTNHPQGNMENKNFRSTVSTFNDRDSREKLTNGSG